MFSNYYLKQLQKVHGRRSLARGFGGKVKKLGKFYSYMDKWNPTSLLDYGCGKGTILNSLSEKYPNVRCTGYDPAVVEYASIPKRFPKFDLVFSNDVMEHIEPEYIDKVLQHINELSVKYVWFRIDTKPARKFLADGRNAHLILEDQEWWENKIASNIQGIIVYSNLNEKGKLDIAIEK